MASDPPLAALAPHPPGMRITPCTALDLGPRFEIVTHGLIVAANLDAKKLEETLSLASFNTSSPERERELLIEMGHRLDLRVSRPINVQRRGPSDVLLAWWLKTGYGHRSAVDPASINLFYPVNLCETPIFPGASVLTTPYIHNAYLEMPTMPLITISALRTESLTEIALIIRRAIIAFNADINNLVEDVRWRCSNPFARLAPSPPNVELLSSSFSLIAASRSFGRWIFLGRVSWNSLRAQCSALSMLS
ncbi:hypothetical protein C8R43DRAFT_1245225 [Mycena crocata]|nr:hypothetical protein C8R43DRAFT_1245225 [Mycena crocata]